MRLQFRLLLAVPKDIVTIGGKLNGAYARNAGRSYIKTAYDREVRQRNSSLRLKKRNGASSAFQIKKTVI